MKVEYQLVITAIWTSLAATHPCFRNRRHPQSLRASPNLYRCAQSSSHRINLSTRSRASRWQIDRLWMGRIGSRRRKWGSMIWSWLAIMRRIFRSSSVMKRQALSTKSRHPRDSTCSQAPNSGSASSKNRPKNVTSRKSHFQRTSSPSTKSSSLSANAHSSSNSSKLPDSQGKTKQLKIPSKAARLSLPHQRMAPKTLAMMTALLLRSKRWALNLTIRMMATMIWATSGTAVTRNLRAGEETRSIAKISVNLHHLASLVRGAMGTLIVRARKRGGARLIRLVWWLQRSKVSAKCSTVQASITSHLSRLGLECQHRPEREWWHLWLAKRKSEPQSKSNKLRLN